MQTNYSHTHFAPELTSYVYHREMLMHKAGYPLYMPTPLDGRPASHREIGIRVGDVGFINAHGAFYFMFNACQHHDMVNTEVPKL